MDLKNPTRTEALLANIAGHTDVPVPDLKNATRSERLLKEILDNGGGGGGDVTKEYVDTAIANAVADIGDDISALSDTVADKVDKVNGKSLSTNDYTDADKALVQNSPITTTSTASPISTANGKPRKLTIYGKSEIVDGVIKSAGGGYAVVDLGTLTWTYQSTLPAFSTTISDMKNITIDAERIFGLYCSKYVLSNTPYAFAMPDKSMLRAQGRLLYIKNLDYTDPAQFKTAMNDVLLCYELDDPTQGNAIAVKTDNGYGIDGTMAVFETGTPLYGIDENIRDVMAWDGTSGEVTNNCGEVDLGTLDYSYDTTRQWFLCIGLKFLIKPTPTIGDKGNILCPIYTTYSISDMWSTSVNNAIGVNEGATLYVRNTDYTDPTAFKIAMSGVKLIYEVATSTITPLTTTELASLSALKTYSPQTTITINDSPDYSIEAYANTANGQAISDMQPTRSPLLTLTASGWTNNTQTVTFAHDTAKRNSIDVEPASIKAWTAAGILATAETASTITFECDTVPTADLSFRVTSMEVR